MDFVIFWHYFYFWFMLFRASGHGLKSVITDKARYFVDY